jgi:hypothetical protein
MLSEHELNEIKRELNRLIASLNQINRELERIHNVINQHEKG